MSVAVYKWLNGRESPYARGFRYRLGAWLPAIQGQLVPCDNAYHGCAAEHLSSWVASDLFVIESQDEWLDGDDKLYTRGPVRIVEHLRGWSERTARLAAADFAERVLPIWESCYPDDDLPRRAIEAARACALGETDSTAADAAHAAAARAAAQAAHAAAWHASWAARAAAWAAAADAAAVADAAVAAAGYDAMRRWQGERILDYAYGGGNSHD